MKQPKGNHAELTVYFSWALGLSAVLSRDLTALGNFLWVMFTSNSDSSVRKSCTVPSFLPDSISRAGMGRVSTMEKSQWQETRGFFSLGFSPGSVGSSWPGLDGA